MAYLPEPPFAHGSTARTGVLLVNLGTPDAPTAGAVRRYLAQFLWDPRVVEIPRALWWLILRFILLTRPARSAAKYAPCGRRRVRRFASTSSARCNSCAAISASA